MQLYFNSDSLNSKNAVNASLFLLGAVSCYEGAVFCNQAFQLWRKPKPAAVKVVKSDDPNEATTLAAIKPSTNNNNEIMFDMAKGVGYLANGARIFSTLYTGA